MIGHMDNHLNLRNIILARYPKVIVECGAGEGATTRLLNHLKTAYEFDLHVISDKEIEGIDPEIIWTTGISYQELSKFPDNHVDLCIIDTDHNYWTLQKELEAVAPKMSEGGLIVMHDIEEFYHDTGMALSYWNGVPYPRAEIEAAGKVWGGLGDALIDFLCKNRHAFKLMAYVTEDYGAAVIEKRTIKSLRIVTPGTDSVFAPPVPEAGAVA